MTITAEELLQRYAAGERDFRRINLGAFFVRPPWLIGVNLSNVDLGGVYIESGGLMNTNLRSANLERSHFTNTLFINTNLSNTNLRSANLDRANLTGANLSDANLSGANLSGANLTDANLANIQVNERTIFVIPLCLMAVLKIVTPELLPQENCSGVMQMGSETLEVSFCIVVT